MELGLAGRWALVTGGSKGIGLACALRLASEGCSLVLAARGTEALEAARTAAAAAGGGRIEVRTEVVDIADDLAAPALADRYGSVLDILVNNAGAIPGGGIADVDQAAWRAGWDLKVFGTIGLCRAFHAAMARRGRGVIVNVIGWAGERVDAGYVAGSSGNAALMALTRALGADGPRHGVRVVGVNPGPVATGRLEVLQRKRAQALFGDAGRWPELVQAMPFGRAGTADEIAAAVAFLASDLSAYTTGTVLTIDGGLSYRM